MVCIRGYFCTLVVFLCAAVFLPHLASGELDCTACDLAFPACPPASSYVNIFNISGDGMIWTSNTESLGGLEVWCNETSGLFVGRPDGIPILRIDDLIDAHAERADYANYPYNINLSAGNAGIQIKCDYIASCAMYDTCVVSMESDTNSHVWGCSLYPLKLCCNASFFTVTPRFLERRIYMSMGETYHAALEVYNPNSAEETITLSLQGTYPAGLAKFLNASGGVLTPDARNMTIKLQGFEKKTLFVELASTDATDWTLGVLVEYASPLIQVTDSIDVTIGFPAAFPGMETVSILAVLILSGTFYWRSRK